MRALSRFLIFTVPGWFPGGIATRIKSADWMSATSPPEAACILVPGEVEQNTHNDRHGDVSDLVPTPFRLTLDR